MTEESSTKTKRRRTRKTRLIKIKKLLFFLIILLVAIWFFLGLKSLIYRTLINVEIMQPGELTENISTEGILIKQEYLIKSPLKGTMKYSISDGQRVKVGTTLGVLEAPSMDTVSGVKQYAVKASVGGMLCNHVDGLETILMPGNLDGVEIPSMDKISNRGQALTEGNVEKGAPVAKVIDNLSPVFLFGTLKAEDYKKIEQRKEPELKLLWQNQTILARVEKLLNDETKGFLLVLKNYPDLILHNRRVKFQFSLGKMEGLLVKDESLVTQGNEEGLFIIWKGLVHWVPVKVKGRLGGQAVIEGADIQPGISYVINPRFAREGDKL
ncbi:hypothetical protein Dred_0711 [Desulforamulus reducens MI-1]|uniref:RND related barrel-sandwich hybrid domain-containing protein n=1 Tax=Desulforamulus reducens (strain ATCC BAA-1160 / DSM 100696 / MI-1) TaxID=349161 RepID=A4J2E7_DESRM|nr:HlyD family efflux transporter periplasmic adaptor subunit [Desulforamulus reducens]ABO49250.1 hypothetical protein Dred_0711 [Desulforamulus reducens MI-1]